MLIPLFGQEALILTAAEEQEDPNKFCSDRHEEGWHCDGKKRVHCEREGREWKANRKHECDRACRRGKAAKNTLIQTNNIATYNKPKTTQVCFLCFWQP